MHSVHVECRCKTLLSGSSRQVEVILVWSDYRDVVLLNFKATVTPRLGAQVEDPAQCSRFPKNNPMAITSDLFINSRGPGGQSDSEEGLWKRLLS
jgi:hypothetical protein